MSPDVRLATIVSALEAVGLSCLVMGGHAVRYYGLNRDTNDFDLHLTPAAWEDLPERLSRTGLFADQPPTEGPSWRPQAFRRFRIGWLPTGREEWLEFWRENHLLPPFSELFGRREEGLYGGRTLAFLSLPDLIRSKETERETDWQDVAYLEEFLDARLRVQVESGSLPLETALGQLRSRRGFESYFLQGQLGDPGPVQAALALARLPVTQAFLLPFAPSATDLPPTLPPIEPVVGSRLRTVTPGSKLHLTLVEAVRRQYKVAAQSRDRADKQAIREAMWHPERPDQGR